VDANGAELMLLPLATVGTGILVPVSAAEQIQKAVAIHVEHRDAFGMVGAETMGEEGDARFAAGAVTRVLHSELSGMGGILAMPRTGGKKTQDEQRDQTLGCDLHGGSSEGVVRRVSWF